MIDKTGVRSSSGRRRYLIRRGSRGDGIGKMEDEDDLVLELDRNWRSTMVDLIWIWIPYWSNGVIHCLMA